LLSFDAYAYTATTNQIETDMSLKARHIGATWQIELNLCFLQPTQVHNSNGKSIGSAIFAQLTAQYH